MKPGFWFLAGGNHIFVVPGRHPDGWLFFWHVKSPCLSLNLDGGYRLPQAEPGDVLGFFWNRALDVHSETGTPGTPGTLTSLTRASKSKTHQRWYFLMWMIPRLTWPKQCQATKEGLNPDGSFKLSTLNMGRWSCFSRLSVLGKHAVYDEPLEVNEQV